MARGLGDHDIEQVIVLDLPPDGDITDLNRYLLPHFRLRDILPPVLNLADYATLLASFGSYERCSRHKFPRRAPSRQKWQDLIAGKYIRRGLEISQE